MAQVQKLAEKRTEKSDGERWPAIERRSGQRLFTLLRTGLLMTGSRQTICRVRNISANGFMADACPAPPRGERIALELCEGHRLFADVAWEQGDRFGAEFLFPQDLLSVLGRVRQAHHFHPRAVRIEPEESFATLVSAEHRLHASILNISQTGMAIAACGPEIPFAPPREIRAEIDGLGAVRSWLRWVDGNRAGLRFSEPVSFESLGHWIWATAMAASAAPVSAVAPALGPVCAIRPAAGPSGAQTTG